MIDLSAIINSEYPIDSITDNKDYLLSGSGSLASVYIHKNLDIAVKIITSQDEGFAAYVNAINQSNYNPMFPKIYSKFISNSGQSIYVMEKLFHITYFYDESSEIYRNIISNIRGIQLAYWGEEKYIKQLTAEEQDAIDTIKLAEIYAKELVEIQDDLHAGNFMLRDANTLVITDPLCDNEGLSLNY